MLVNISKLGCNLIITHLVTGMHMQIMQHHISCMFLLITFVTFRNMDHIPNGFHEVQTP